MTHSCPMEAKLGHFMAISDVKRQILHVLSSASSLLSKICDRSPLVQDSSRSQFSSSQVWLSLLSVLKRGHSNQQSRSAAVPGCGFKGVSPAESKRSMGKPSELAKRVWQLPLTISPNDRNRRFQPAAKPLPSRIHPPPTASSLSMPIAAPSCC